MLLFYDVANAFEEIEKRSGRLEMTDILAELFKKTSSGEIGKLIYLIQGILAPPYIGMDLGLGERFALEALAASSGYQKSQIERAYKESGDLGDTAQKMLQKKKQMALYSTEMSITYLYDALIKISKAAGSGSQDQKIKILAEILNNCTPLEAKFVVRFVVGSLRLGIGDPTILDALSVVKTGDKSLREPLERAYNVCSDLGHVAEVFYEKPESIAKFEVRTFRPLMPALAERENSTKAIIDRLGKCGIELKYDGFRLQCHKKGDRVELYSRKLEIMTPMFPDLVDAIKKLKVEEIIFDSEALAYDSKKKRYFPFQQTMQRRRKHGIAEASEKFPLNLFVFDVIYFDGKDLTGEQYKSRRKLIEIIFGSAGSAKKFRRNGKPRMTPSTNEILKPCTMKLVSKENEMDKIFQNAIAEGLEGIMAKDLEAPYTAGKRKFAWIKLKKSYGQSVDTIDAIVVGYYLGQGARAEFEFGGLLVAVHNADSGRMETIARIGSGFSEDEMQLLKEMLEKIKTSSSPENLDYNPDKVTPDFWVRPKYVVEVAFDDITESQMHTCRSVDGKGLALRFPRLVRIRDDKGVEEATTTHEVEQMFEKQRTRNG